MLDTCTVTWGDQTIEFRVQDIQLEYEPTYFDMNYGSAWTGNVIAERTPKIALKGVVTKMITKKELEKVMGYSDGDVAAKNCSDANNLSKKYASLELDYDDRLLREQGIVSLDGTLTEKGKDFVLNVLFSDYKKAVVEALDEIATADEEKEQQLDFVLIIVSMLAVWRAVYMIQQETGPLEIFSKFQAWFWTDPVQRGGFKDGLRCFNCTSIWLSFFAALFIPHATLGIFLLNWFAISAGAMFINAAHDKLQQ